MSVQQIEALIEYLEGQPELALGRCLRSKEGRSLAKRLWQECAEILNSVSADCSQKTSEQWRMFYNEYKHRLLKKIKKEKSEKTATGGGPAMSINLTELQERLYTILGRDVGEPLPGVRHNPLTLTNNEGGSSGSLHDDGVIIVNEESQEDSIQEDPGFVQMEFVGFEHQPEPSVSQLPREILEESEISFSQLLLELAGQRQQPQPTVSASFEGLEPTIEGQQSESAGSQVAPNTQAARASQAGQRSRQSAPRRHRRRRQQITENEDQDQTQSAMHRATERLEAIEQASAQATREHAQATKEHAQATNRLAAAIEALGDWLKEPIKIKLENSPQTVCQGTQGRKRFRIYDSDSE